MGRTYAGCEPGAREASAKGECSGSDFVSRARDGNFAEAFDCEDAGAREFGELRNASKEREQSDIAKGNAVASGGKGFERERRAVELEKLADVSPKLGMRIAGDFDGGKLPHAGEEHVVVGAGITNEDRATVRIAEDGGSDPDFHHGRLAARGGNFAGEALCPRAAAARDGAVGAARRLRRADHFAEFHQGLIPIAGRFVCEEMLGHVGEALPAAGRAKVATNCAEPGENARDVTV